MECILHRFQTLNTPFARRRGADSCSRQPALRAWGVDGRSSPPEDGTLSQADVELAGHGERAALQDRESESFRVFRETFMPGHLRRYCPAWLLVLLSFLLGMAAAATVETPDSESAPVEKRQPVEP